MAADTAAPARVAPDACPDDLPRACNRIWRYLEMVGVEACERGRITLKLLDQAMASTLRDGGHLTPAAMDAMTDWLGKREQMTNADQACGGAAALAESAHPPTCRQSMAPERRYGRGRWHRRLRADQPPASHSP